MCKLLLLLHSEVGVVMCEEGTDSLADMSMRMVGEIYEGVSIGVMPLLSLTM